MSVYAQIPWNGLEGNGSVACTSWLRIEFITVFTGKETTSVWLGSGSLFLLQKEAWHLPAEVAFLFLLFISVLLACISQYTYGFWDERLESSPARRDLGVLINSKLNCESAMCVPWHHAQGTLESAEWAQEDVCFPCKRWIDVCEHDWHVSRSYCSM